MFPGQANASQTSTDPGVARAITASGHFINEDKRVEHQRMQATLHMMTALGGYKVKSHEHSLFVARINEHVSEVTDTPWVHQLADNDIPAPSIRYQD
jgi:hypothetical protein